MSDGANPEGLEDIVPRSETVRLEGLEKIRRGLMGAVSGGVFGLVLSGLLGIGKRGGQGDGCGGWPRYHWGSRRYRVC